MFVIIDKRTGALMAEVPGDSIRDERFLWEVLSLLTDEARLPATVFMTAVIDDEGKLRHLPSRVAGMASKGVDVSGVALRWPDDSVSKTEVWRPCPKPVPA